MRTATARLPFGSADCTQAALREQDGQNGAPQGLNGLEIDAASGATSLVAYKEDCGTDPRTCPRQHTVDFWCQDDGRHHLFRIVCKTWACPYCGPIKRAELAARIKAAKPNRFVTLTAAPNQDETPRKVFDRTRRQISELAKVYRREGREFEFCRVLETHQSGYPHYHLIVRSPWLDQRELSYRWCCLTESYIVDVRKLSNDNKGVNYVMKYLGKQESTAFTQRRVSYTRNFFPKRPPDPPSIYNPIDIVRHSGSLEDVVYWEYRSCDWEHVNKWHWIARPKQWQSQQNSNTPTDSSAPF